MKTFDVQQRLGDLKIIRWLPYGQAVAYLNSTAGVSNIWIQPLDGGQAKQFTNFNNEQSFYFDWSTEGKPFACVHGYITCNLVAISRFK